MKEGLLNVLIYIIFLSNPCMYKNLLIFCSFQMLFYILGRSFTKKTFITDGLGLKPRILMSFSRKRGVLTKCFVVRILTKIWSSKELSCYFEKEKNKTLVSKLICVCVYFICVGGETYQLLCEQIWTFNDRI